jgi:putative ABC transport system ATP-binding protein
VGTGVRVLECLLEVNETLGTTTLLITHNSDIARLGDRVIRFADGLIHSDSRNTERTLPSLLRW